MTKLFEDYFSEMQADMVTICLDYVNHKAENIYIYCSYEPKVYFFNVFFRINGEIVHKHQLNKAMENAEEKLYDVSETKQDAVLDIGVMNLQEIHKLCKKFNRDMPTEMKLYYDVDKNSLTAEYKYDLVYSNHDNLLPANIFVEWFEEIKNDIEG